MQSEAHRCGVLIAAAAQRHVRGSGDTLNFEKKRRLGRQRNSNGSDHFEGTRVVRNGDFLKEEECGTNVVMLDRPLTKRFCRPLFSKACGLPGASADRKR
jgi:hypothetical protein